MFGFTDKTTLVGRENALPGCESYPFPLARVHAVTGAPLLGPFPHGLQSIVFGLGCFWGAEEIFWQIPGVYTTAVGYTGGFTAHPTYEQVCSGRTGHTEAVLVVFDPDQVRLGDLLATFFEVHDPTQGMRQGNDVGTQYRSAIYYTDPAQRIPAEQAKALYEKALAGLGYPAITTSIEPLGEFYYAEDYHQQYLHKVPNGYRCHATAGVPFPRAELV